MENRLKGATALELLFIAFVLLKVVGVPPVNGWSWFGWIAAPLYLHLFFALCYRVWEKMGLRQMFYVTLEMKRYDIMLARAKKQSGKVLKQEHAARLNKLQREIERTNRKVYEENAVLNNVENESEK